MTKKIILLLIILIYSVGFSQDITGKIQNYLDNNKEKFKLTSQDVSDWFIEGTGNSDATGINTYHIRQRYQGTEIFNAISNVWEKNGEIINVANRFFPNISQKINATTPSLSVLVALQKAFVLVNVSSSGNQIIETISSKEFKISNGTSTEVISAKLVYQPIQNKLKLAWDFTIPTLDGNHVWSIRVDALTGEKLQNRDMVVSCNFDKNDCAGFQYTNRENFSFYRNLVKEENAFAPVQVLGGSYRAVPFNFFSPNDTSRQLIANPENALASPNGWHNASTTIGGTTASSMYTYLRGNNVWSRSDYTGAAASSTTASTTSTANGYSPTNSGLIFDYPYPGTSVAANTYIDASTTNLFYMNNICHDIWYQYGFNEANGNFQKSNLGRGGVGNDYIFANAQDGSTATTPTLNNSNFYSPGDGTNGRMRMYLWSYRKLTHLLTVNSPSSVAGVKTTSDNGFNPGHVNVPVAPAMILSDLVLYEDGTNDPGYTDGADACGAATNAAAINGHIALVRRSVSTAMGGTPCNFTVKVKNAQLAGATAVIVYNNVNVDATSGYTITTPITMSGSDATITIPAISVTMEVGQALHDQITGGTTVNAQIQSPTQLDVFVNTDGDFDNGVIAHEFGHGISLRMTTGSPNALNNPEQMGEGWSDWFSLMLQMQPGDVGTTPKGLANFVMNQAPDDSGLRYYPYSTDMSINPETFGYTNGGTAAPYFPVIAQDANGTDYVEPHNVGEIWTTMLWDLTWAYVAKYGYDDNKYTGTGGNNKVMRLVLDAIKLQPSGPSFVDARDALIAADQATTGGADYCTIWQAFARRGLGLNASSGDNSGDAYNTAAILDQIEDFTVPASCALSVNYFENDSNFRVYPNPSNGQFNIHINQFVGKVNIQVVDINGRIVLNNDNVDFNLEKTIDLSGFQAGMYILKVSADNLNYSQKLMKN